jgi:hypothetical protein
VTELPARRHRLAAVCTVLCTVGAFLVGCSGSDPERSDPAAPDDAQVLVALPLRVDDDALASLETTSSFVTLERVAAAAGASQQAVDATRQAARALDLELDADPTRSVLWGTVDVGTAERVFGVDLVVETADGVRTIVPRGTPTIPEGFDEVTGVVGLTASLGSPASAPVTGATNCPADPETASELAARFGTVTPGDAPAPSVAPTVAVLAIEQYEPAVAATYAACVGSGPDASRVTTSAVKSAPAAVGGPELALDTLVIGLLAPSASIDVTRFDAATSLVFPLLHALDRAQAAGATPDVLAFTVGDCEQVLGDAELGLAEWLLGALAATGTTSIAATGDQGSSACAPHSDAPSVQYPASSPSVTAVGGASFTGPVTDPASLAVWNDAPTQERAGGGGTSARLDRPSWQAQLSTPGDGRALPDLVAYAEPSGMGSLPVCSDATTCVWQQLGGTSLAAAGLAALVAQAVAVTGTRFGALSDTLARAGGDGRAPAIDVTTGTNHVFSTACCSAGPGFDLASGWGLFDVTRLTVVAQQ